MENLTYIKERYLKEPINKRLGHLASNLARISSFLEGSKNTEAIGDILEESKFFIEWTAPKASPDIQALLSQIQSKLALCHRHLLLQKENHRETGELKKKAKIWSALLIKNSSLLTT